jgi:hypothetical protein
VLKCVDRRIRQLIDAFVAWHPGMALDPAPFELVAPDQLIQLLPQILVFDGLLVGGTPAALFPVVYPLGDAASRARMTAVSSIRLLVVRASAPFSSFSISPMIKSAPQPPGPGLPRQAPSV